MELKSEFYNILSKTIFSRLEDFLLLSSGLAKRARAVARQKGKITKRFVKEREA